jgi:hypothetical protein
MVIRKNRPILKHRQKALCGYFVQTFLDDSHAAKLKTLTKIRDFIV